MFRGQFNHTIDSKGRVSFPARFREQLETRGDSRLVITKAVLDDRCLHVYSSDEWEKLVAYIQGLPSFNKQIVRFTRLYVAPAMDLPIDAAGRVHISPEFREHAVLERDVVWSAGSKYIELWSKQQFERATQIPQEEYSEFSAQVRELIRI